MGHDLARKHWTHSEAFRERKLGAEPELGASGVFSGLAASSDGGCFFNVLVPFGPFKEPCLENGHDPPYRDPVVPSQVRYDWTQRPMKKSKVEL